MARNRPDPQTTGHIPPLNEGNHHHHLTHEPKQDGTHAQKEHSTADRPGPDSHRAHRSRTKDLHDPRAPGRTIRLHQTAHRKQGRSADAANTGSAYRGGETPSSRPGTRPPGHEDSPCDPRRRRTASWWALRRADPPRHTVPEPGRILSLSLTYRTRAAYDGMERIGDPGSVPAPAPGPAAAR